MSMRRRHEEAHENHERWLVSYADFITLMFAFFVVMFAASQSDKAKTKAVAVAVESALRDDKFTAKIRQVLHGTIEGKSSTGNADLAGLRRPNPNEKPAPPPAKLAELTPSLRKLTAELKKEIEAGLIQIDLMPRGLVISLKEGAFFAPGDDTVNKDRFGIIAKLATTIKLVPNPVRLEGHTDSTPIRNGRFRNNWELSAARSIAALELLRDRFAVEQSRMAIVGYADTVASSTNETEEGRAHNRRVDITILNEASDSMEAKPGAKPAPAPGH